MGGILIAIAGPSGVGKGTVVRELLERDHNCRVSISATTRLPRDQEIDGSHYFFLSKPEFERRVLNNEMLEYELYNGNYYGTPAKNVIDNLNRGLDVILEIDVKGALQIKKKMPEALILFLKPPTILELERRLKSRGTELDAEIQKRLKISQWELEQAPDFDFIVINDTLKTAVSEVANIINKRRGYEKGKNKNA